MLDGRPGRGAGAAVVSGNHHMVGLALGHTGGNRTNADFSDQLDADAGMRRDIFQVVYQLRQIFDRVNVVMWRGRNQAHTGHRVAQATDVIGHLAAWQLTALARLGALCHLDLDLVGAGQVFGRDAKASRGHLLDARAQ